CSAARSIAQSAIPAIRGCPAAAPRCLRRRKAALRVLQMPQRYYKLMEMHEKLNISSASASALLSAAPAPPAAWTQVLARQAQRDPRFRSRLAARALIVAFDLQHIAPQCRMPCLASRLREALTDGDRSRLGALRHGRREALPASVVSTASAVCVRTLRIGAFSCAFRLGPAGLRLCLQTLGRPRRPRARLERAACVDFFTVACGEQNVKRRLAAAQTQAECLPLLPARSNCAAEPELIRFDAILQKQYPQPVLAESHYTVSKTLGSRRFRRGEGWVFETAPCHRYAMKIISKKRHILSIQDDRVFSILELAEVANFSMRITSQPNQSGFDNETAKFLCVLARWRKLSR
uniref:PI3K/PI4K domain-containing protein n=1 Tax=Macrostomum lignano TaxID=282301 RepID=A0A1I8FMP2_9PLAT